MRWMIAAAFLALAALATWLAIAGREPSPIDDGPSPYVADTASPVRGLSAQEVDDLMNGRGAGYARTAELNSYPGPRHALDLADRLALRGDQRARIESIFAAMQAQAKTLGAQIVERERRLSASFAGRGVTEPLLRAQVDTLAELYGALRATHLAAHLETTAVLSHEQIGRYSELRGYGKAHAH